jgi:hypothetical protein
MPKETVYSKYYGRSTPDHPEPEVTVGWSKESEHVEMAVLMPEGVPLEVNFPESNGWYAQLDRAGINRLIKILRKARDDAYGRDE